MSTQTRYPEATIEADKEVPIIRITRDFRGTPAQLMKAHTDPELFVRWVQSGFSTDLPPRADLMAKAGSA